MNPLAPLTLLIFHSFSFYKSCVDDVQANTDIVPMPGFFRFMTILALRMFTVKRVSSLYHTPLLSCALLYTLQTLISSQSFVCKLLWLNLIFPHLMSVSGRCRHFGGRSWRALRCNQCGMHILFMNMDF
jgi:hypothetical protein